MDMLSPVANEDRMSIKANTAMGADKMRRKADKPERLALFLSYVILALTRASLAAGVPPVGSESTVLLKLVLGDSSEAPQFPQSFIEGMFSAPHFPHLISDPRVVGIV